MQIDKSEGLKDRVAKALIIGEPQNLPIKCQEMHDVIKDQQAQEARLTAIVKELREALEGVLNDLKDRSRWDDEVKVIPLGSSVYIKAEQALLRAEQIEGELNVK